MIVDLQPFAKVPAKAILLRRSDFAAFYQSNNRKYLLSFTF